MLNTARLLIVAASLFVAGLVDAGASIPKNRVGDFFDRAPVLTAPASQQVAEPHLENLSLYDWNAAGSTLWTHFDPEGLWQSGDGAGQYFKEMGQVFQGYGDVTIGAAVSTARAVVNLPSNVIAGAGYAHQLSQMDSRDIGQGLQTWGAQSAQAVKQATSEFVDRLEKGDARTWGQTVGTALTLGGAKGAQFAKVAEVEEAGDAGLAGAVERTGPKGVDPNHHNANVTVRDADGNIVSHERVVSGSMTAEEKAMGFPKGSLASHTEARAVEGTPLEAGQSMTITGQKKPPCPSCKGTMNKAAAQTGGEIKYQWRQDGKTQKWKANAN